MYGPALPPETRRHEETAGVDLEDRIGIGASNAARGEIST
jgi:hypothetical protein